jgi:hypothetical protein
MRTEELLGGGSGIIVPVGLLQQNGEIMSQRMHTRQGREMGPRTSRTRWNRQGKSVVGGSPVREYGGLAAYPVWWSGGKNLAGVGE